MKGSGLTSLLVVLSLGALVIAGLTSAVAVDDGTDTIIRLPSDGEGVAVDGEEVEAGERPWKCCNTPHCTRSFPPTCQCMDTVSKCFSACRRCQEVRPGSRRYHCLDSYKGQPGPNCNQADETNQDVTNGVTSDDEEAEVAIPAPEAVDEENAGGKRPWKCCSTPHCTRSFPPTCQCMDTVSKCFSACRRCQEVRPGSHRYHCLDSYKGQPGPKCNQADDETNQGVTDGVTSDDEEAEVAIPAPEAVDEENAGGKRPWKCCNTPHCTRSFPPTCQCVDTVSKCFSACRRCQEVRPGSRRYRCLDSYEGQPGPKCN